MIARPLRFAIGRREHIGHVAAIAGLLRHLEDLSFSADGFDGAADQLLEHDADGVAVDGGLFRHERKLF